MRWLVPHKKTCRVRKNKNPTLKIFLRTKKTLAFKLPDALCIVYPLSLCQFPDKLTLPLVVIAQLDASEFGAGIMETTRLCIPSIETACHFLRLNVIENHVISEAPYVIMSPEQAHNETSSFRMLRHHLITTFVLTQPQMHLKQLLKNS